MATKDGRRIRKNTAYGTLSEERLRAQLDHDAKNKIIVVGRASKISRKHYAELMGCTRSALSPYKYVFSEYELKHEIEFELNLRTAKMCAWIRDAYEARELDIRGVKLDRAEFRKHFELGINEFNKPDCATNLLFKDLDSRLVSDGYISNKLQQELARVSAILKDGATLGRTRLTINLEELARVSGISEKRFRSHPFAALLSARNAEILSEVKLSKIDPFIHGRVFPFSQLTTLWPLGFLELLGVRFKQIKSTSSEQSVKQPYLALLAALEWIGSSSNPNCIAVVKEARKVGRILSASEWEDALFAYRDYVIGNTSAELAANAAIALLRPTLEGMSSKGILPPTSASLPSIKHARRRQKPLRSVAEVSATDSYNDSSNYIEFTRNYYSEVGQSSNTEIGKRGADEFLKTLASELDGFTDLPVDPAAAVRRILERRLDVLKNRAVEILDDAMKKHQTGQRLMATAKIDLAEFERVSIDNEFGAYAWARYVANLFPFKDSSEGKIEQGTANLLYLISEQYSGIAPTEYEKTLKLHSKFFVHRYSRYGGLNTIVPMLHSDLDAVCAVLTLYLIESGANVSVGRTLDRECLESSDIKGYSRITGHKARAQGKPIIVDLPDTSVAVRAIKWLQSASTPLQNNATVDSDRLFLTRKGREIQVVTASVFNHWFKRMSQSCSGLEGIKLTPSMIRPSVLLHASLANDGRLATGLAFGQHSLTVTQGYQQKWPTRLLYDENIRRFQGAFETLVMSSIEDAASKLGITSEEFEDRMGYLKATGLGTFCRNARGRPNESSNQCSKLDCWNECPHLLIVAEVESIATLQLWQGSLRSARPEWERDRPERWDQVWLPWLCLTDVVEEKMARGPLLKIWKKAIKRAAEISSQSNYVVPRPW